MTQLEKYKKEIEIHERLKVTHRALQLKFEKLEAEYKLLVFMVENGLGEQDITYPNEL